MAEIKTQGFEELARKLRQLPDRVADKVLPQAVRAAANLVKTEAQSRAPVSTEPHYVGRRSKGLFVFPGFLAGNLAVRRERAPRGVASFKVGVRSRAFYWRFIEFGTSNPKQPARPFLRPALSENVDKAINTMRDKLAGRIQAEAKKL